MRFRTAIQNISTFAKLTGSLTALGKVAWVNLNEETVRFTVIPDTGTQVWAVLSVDTIFSNYHINSAADNVINLELPLDTLNRGLKSCTLASQALLRLTKKANNVPFLSLTITTTTSHSATPTIITQDIPVRLLSVTSVANIHEPTCPEPDVHICLPALSQLRAITERFVKLAPVNGRIVLEGNMNGGFKMRVEADSVRVESAWNGLVNPVLDQEQLMNGEEREHPSQSRDPDEYAAVRVEAKDWARVVKVGALGKRVIACFCEDHALVLYVYLNDIEDQNSAVLTYYITSYSA